MKYILSCWDVLLVTQEPLKFKNSMSQDPKIAISVGIYSIEGPGVGFMRGGVAYIYIDIYICICIYIYAHTYTYTHKYVYTHIYLCTYMYLTYI